MDIEHARHVADAFQSAGVTADTVEGGTPIKERQRMYQDLRQEQLMVLTSCNVISIGFDEPSVEVGLLLRPTQSSALHLQQIGRVMRISPQTGKQYGIILDQAGNLERLGFPEDIKDYQLPLQKDKGGGGGKPPPTKPCPQCGRIVLSFIVKCPDCGHQWISERPLNLEDMVEIYSADQAHQINDIPTLINLFHSHRRRAYLRQNAPTWAERSFWEHCGRWPKDEWYRGSIYGPNPRPVEMLEYLQYLQKKRQAPGQTRGLDYRRVRKKNVVPVVFSGWPRCGRKQQSIFLMIFGLEFCYGWNSITLVPMPCVGMYPGGSASSIKRQSRK